MISRFAIHFTSNKKNPLSSKNSESVLLNHLFICFILILLSGCAASKRYGEEEKKIPEETKIPTEVPESKVNSIRVMIDEVPDATFITVQNNVEVFDDKNKIALINSGNTMEFYESGNYLSLQINGETFTSALFRVESASDAYVSINGKSYKGSLNIYPSENSIEIINTLDIEDYLKGVLSGEMPVGKGTENLESLKALAVSARTYALLRINEKKDLYDLFPDTRDQVYGGKNSENPLSNQAVEETSGLILTYKNSPAQIYYHSTCGGFTESAENVFTDFRLDYLKSIEDGSPPYCSISPRFEWTEIFSDELIIQRLKDAALISHSNYTLEEFNILSRFDSGRVNELRIILADENDEEKSISIFGNDIRQVLKNADGKMILWSNFFDANVEDEKIILNGKGFGHGVGLCQWGAISLSKNGWNFEDILNHYYPGTELQSLND
ncbi:MAG TPA: SpoIID/LytB domain-containing protein [Ignavibacteriaceae bacterium]